MKQSNFAAYALTAILSVLAAYVIGFGQALDSYSYTLSDDQYVECGLDKLSQEELTHLFRFIESIPHISYLEESGTHYLREEGWEAAQLYGVQKLRAGALNDEDDYLVGVLDQRVQIIKLPLLVDRLSPGWYWVKPSGSTWTILHADGTSHLYWIQEKRE